MIVLSSVAPYADAVFTDNAMAGLMAEAPSNEMFLSTAQVFSNRTKDRFMDYLDSIEAEADPRLLDLIVEIYGEKWPEPYYGFVEYVKGRRQSDSP